MARATTCSDAPRRRIAALLLAGLSAAALWCLTPPAAHAQGPASASAPQVVNAHPAWSELSPVHQRILAPLEPLWDTLPELNRRKWLRIADRYPKFSPAEQARLQTRMGEWVKLTPQQRRLARENYQITRSLPPEKKAEAWDKYQQLPEEQKKNLAAAERVPRRPGAVSALPSGKHLPGDTTRQLRQEKKQAPLAAGKPASESAAKAVNTTAPASAPAAAPVAPSPVSPAPATIEAGSEAAAATPADTTVRQ